MGDTVNAWNYRSSLIEAMHVVAIHSCKVYVFHKAFFNSSLNRIYISLVDSHLEVRLAVFVKLFVFRS